jgi:hypothetical protein
MASSSCWSTPRTSTRCGPGPCDSLLSRRESLAVLSARREPDHGETAAQQHKSRDRSHTAPQPHNPMALATCSRYHPGTPNKYCDARARLKYK